jgi:hypothetical protein
MSWYAQTEEAQKHMRECKGCENCIWIEESAYAMSQYGTVSEGEPHPLLDKIKEKFLGKEVK